MFDYLRERVPLEDMLEAEVGQKTPCVFHEEENPSMHIYEESVYCFGCGAYGDVVSVWATLHNIESQFEAAIDLARARGIKLPHFSPEDREKMDAGRRAEENYLADAREFHNNLDAHPRVREWWASRGFDEALQKRFVLGASSSSVATIPYWSGGRVKGIIRRKLEGEPKYVFPSIEEFVDGYKPLFSLNSARNGQAFLVEGPIDALAVNTAGHDAVAVGGAQMSEQQRSDIDGRQLLILPDRDENGTGVEAAKQWARQLYPDARICAADYGAEDRGDVADLFKAEGPDGTTEHLSRLVRSAQDLLDLETAEIAAMEGDARQKLREATETVVPLLANIISDSERGAALDIVKERTKLQKGWLVAAVKEEIDRRNHAAMQEIAKRMERERQQASEEHQRRVADAQPEIDDLFARPGVLKRARKAASKIHNVKRDEQALDLQLLIALGAQLAPLPNGRPLGASDLLTAEAGRGKNHLADAAVKILPEEFYFTFEIASGQSLYYAADEDPDFLKHKFAYPNEIEGVEALVEFLRPMLSKGWCRKFVTDKDPVTGRNMLREIIVEGPVTTTIPTIRNKTDQQLQTRLLVAELPDYKGRVKEHSAAVSELLHPGHGADDFSHELFLWHEGFRQLDVRRVVFPLEHPKFALDDDNISHGARLWANLLGLMSAHAWLEQRNRDSVELDSGERAIVATPADYEAAYKVFTKVCKRSVVNLSDNHRAILTSLYNLQQEDPDRDGFSTRQIAEGTEAAGRKVSHMTVSNNKSFLMMSAKLIKETDDGVALVYGAEPAWWDSSDISVGLPTPEQVRAWWDDDEPPPPGGGTHFSQPGSAENPLHPLQDQETESNPDTNADFAVKEGLDNQLYTSSSEDDQLDRPLHVKGDVKGGVYSENPIDKLKTPQKEGVSSVESKNGGRGAPEKLVLADKVLAVYWELSENGEGVTRERWKYAAGRQGIGGRDFNTGVHQLKKLRLVVEKEKHQKEGWYYYPTDEWKVLKALRPLSTAGGEKAYAPLEIWWTEAKRHGVERESFSECVSRLGKAGIVETHPNSRYPGFRVADLNDDDKEGWIQI